MVEKIIDMQKKVQELKAMLEERWQQDHTHFKQFMDAVLPAANIIGVPVVSVGWMHVVERVQSWRRMLASQQTVLDMAIRALDEGMDPSDIKAILVIQRELLDGSLDMWEPVPKIPGDDD